VQTAAKPGGAIVPAVWTVLIRAADETRMSASRGASRMRQEALTG
jgi:hypothetical protein